MWGGDPLSPLLLNNALDLAATGIRSPWYTDWWYQQLCADDLLIYLLNPDESVPNLLSYIKLFSGLSGYTNLSSCLWRVTWTPFKLVTSHFTDFWLKISKDPNFLFKLNFLDIIDMIGEQKLEVAAYFPWLAAWMLLKRLLFQDSYISFFRKMDSLILSIIWANKPPCISKAYLQKLANRGSLGLRVFKHYYVAANMRALSLCQWNLPIDDQSAVFSLWLMIESMAASETSLPALLFASVQLTYKSLGHNLVLKNSLRILNQIKRAHAHLQPIIICLNQSDLVEERINACFQIWIWIINLTLSVNSKQNTIYASHICFCCLQTRHFIWENVSEIPIKPKGNLLCGTLLLGPNSKLLSFCFFHFYNTIFMGWRTESAVVKIILSLLCCLVCCIPVIRKSLNKIFF